MLWEGLELTPSGATTLERLGTQVGTRYVRDVLDQVQGVSLSAAAISIRDTDWAGWGAPANTTLWNPATHTFEAAGVEAFATAFDAVSSGAIRYEVGLSRNAFGALTAVADSAVAPGVRSRDAAFEYDLAGRLVAAEVSEHHFEYAYDALQNMTRRELVVVPGGAITPDLLSGDYRHCDAATGKRRLQRVDMPGTSTALATFSYDLAGRMTRVGLSAATDTTMAFDAFDRVRVVDEPGSGLTQHRYDAAGERATTVWADGRIERYFGGGLTQREGRLELHVGLGGARVVARVNVPELPDGTASISDGLGGAPAVVYLHQGVGHGPTVVTDAGGAVIEERVFEPYGTPLWVDADYELERLGWNGKAVDPSTGWSDHGARWHATRFARWLSVDPPLKGPGGLVEHGLMATPYGFVAGNPVMLWDPDGKRPFNPVYFALAREFIRNARSKGYAPDASGEASSHYKPNLGVSVQEVRQLGTGRPVGLTTYEGLDAQGRPTGAMSLLFPKDDARSSMPSSISLDGSRPKGDLNPPGFDKTKAKEDVTPPERHTKGHLSGVSDGGRGDEPRNMTTEFLTTNQRQSSFEHNKTSWRNAGLVLTSRTPIYLSDETKAPDGYLYERVSCFEFGSKSCSVHAYVVENGGKTRRAVIENSFLTPAPPTN